jgi:hypothetical protein
MNSLNQFVIAITNVFGVCCNGRMYVAATVIYMEISKLELQ